MAKNCGFYKFFSVATYYYITTNTYSQIPKKTSFS